MTSSTTGSTTGSSSSSSTDASGSRRAAVADRSRDVATNVRDAAETVAAKLPDAAATGRAAVDQAARRIETGSDEMLTAGTTLSIGFALGLLVGGAPRLLVAMAVLPAAAMGLTLLDRNGRGPGRRPA